VSGEAFRYDGKNVVVVGGATGMGAAVAQTAADLGAKVTVLDVADVTYPVARAIKVDLRDRPSVEAAADSVEGPVHALFSCAGVADGTPGLMLINFISQRHFLDRLRQSGRLGRGAAVVMISSVAGLGWQQNLAQIHDFLNQDGWDGAAKWIEAHEGTDNYFFSKQIINTFVASEGFRLLQQGIRLNAVMPGPTDTPLARANAELWLGFGADYREKLGIDALSPQQIANVMTFLCSDAASGINGVTLIVDAGHVGAAIAGSYEDPIISMLAGLSS
jgi:NAD(P)-dependent dehydrogenase (short-subunit alcohol dehydrogenase family)